MEADLALAAVLAYRSVAIWLPAPLGLVALGGLRKTFARWAEEDASMQAPAAVPVLTPHPAPVRRPLWPAPEPVAQVAA